MTKLHKLVRITTVPKSLWKLLEGQLKFMSDTYEVHAVSCPGEKLSVIAEQEGVDVHPIKMTRRLTPIRDMLSVWKMYRLLRKIRPTIVHTHTPKAGLIGMLAGMLAGVPIRLHTVAGMPVETRQGWIRKLLLCAEKMTYACAHKVYPNSNGMKQFIEQERLCAPSKLKIIAKGSSNGINLQHFRRTSEIESCGRELRDQYGIGKEDTVFCFVGRMVRDKGIEELLGAFSEITSSNRNAQLMLAGIFEEHLDPLSEKAKGILTNHPNIHYMGYQSDVRPCFAAADVFVFPSYREGLPNVLLQAGAMGVPSIATRINGNTDIIDDGVNGVLVEPQNEQELLEAMRRVMIDETLRLDITRRSRESIELKYNQQTLWHELRQEYDQLIETKIK